MKTLIVCISALTASMLMVDALACGDSLYRVGKNVAYRTYTAPLPGNLLVYSESEEGRAIAEQLAASGHAVSLVHTAAQLEDALRLAQYDVIIAPVEQQAGVVAARQAGSSYVPVASDPGARRAAEREFGAALKPDDDIKRYLKTIHKTLKARG